MAPARTTICYLLTLLVLVTFTSADGNETAKGGSTGSNRIDSKQCPEDVEDLMVFSPFEPYFTWPKFQGDIQKCWVAADCLFEAAGESRKQQFAATALVMGLIPLTLKDIAWPERRIIHVTTQLFWVVEVLVLALGLVPLVTDNKTETKTKGTESNILARAAWKQEKRTIRIWIVVCIIAVLSSYTGIAFMEIYSKRSALGCTFPVFVLTWYIIALIPASIHALFAGFRRRRNLNKLKKSRSANGGDARKAGPIVLVRQDSEEDQERKKKIISAVQGADEDWPVQLAWGVYYIAGTLVFTSIMAVTVAELVAWVALGFAIGGSSKLLAFFLCLNKEETGEGEDQGAGGLEAGAAPSTS
ncbi:hypothetical protein EJ04DRAFT_510025 [Polyplosphaeria fusca]|uniref:Uncharacterized protein n=1 Tax=Polyplosphaeria fusca TaxID=682080 RepID=A0A9P4R6T9_9PLEO|nr:hypothetical protein EJ04DRAFT_510025 [Polyplosphaeria fusca]